LGRLTERHRTVIRLRVWDRLPFERIGAAMGVSEVAARMLYARALASLRESLGPGHGAE
jgi:DNA-directed RNA polymerase specialized sigma24 family protein